MTRFAKLTAPTGVPIWVNVDLVTTMGFVVNYGTISNAITYTALEFMGGGERIVKETPDDIYQQITPWMSFAPVKERW